MAERKFLFASLEGYPEEQGANDSLSLGMITLLGVGGIAVDAGNARITNVGTPTATSDAATKEYVDSVAAGLSVKDPCEVVSGSNLTLSGLQTVDGYTLLDGDRVLLTGQTTGTENGIWVAHTGAWTRPTDFAAGSSAHGTFVVIVEGASAGTGWVCTDDVGSDVVDTDALTFVQFSGSQDITASTGLVRVGNDIRVKPGDGIEVTSNSGSTNVALSASSPGLALVGTAGSKTLEWAPDTTRGLAKDTSGAYVQLTSNHGLAFNSGAVDLSLDANGGLEADATGLSVKIDATADSLLVGASGLATKSAPQGAKVVTAALDVSAGQCPYWSGAGVVSPGSNSSDAAAHVIGVATASFTTGNSGKVVTWGQAAGVLSGATPNTPYYLSDTGGLTATPPSGGKRVVMMGYALSSTDLWVQIRDYGKKA